MGHEPKYDGFRAIVFVDDGNASFSRAGQAAVPLLPRAVIPSGSYVLDGEIVIDGTKDPRTLARSSNESIRRSRGSRCWPSKHRPDTSRSIFSLGMASRCSIAPFEERRGALEAIDLPGIDLTPSTRSRSEAEPWLRSGEGVVAKEVDAPYRPGQRKGMVKVSASERSMRWSRATGRARRTARSGC